MRVFDKYKTRERIARALEEKGARLLDMFVRERDVALKVGDGACVAIINARKNEGDAAIVKRALRAIEIANYGKGGAENAEA